MYVQRNIVARSRNVYISSTTLPAWYQPAHRRMSLATVESIWGFMYSAPYYTRFNQILNLFTEFHESPQYKISLKSLPNEPNWYKWVDGQKTDEQPDAIAVYYSAMAATNVINDNTTSSSKLSDNVARF
jgi:hypothetical protein